MSQQILFRNFELLEPSFGELRGGYQLLVEGDTVKQLSETPIKASEADVIDCGRRTLMPGLIDCHVHAIHSEVNVRFTIRQEVVSPIEIIRSATMIVVGFTATEGTTGMIDASMTRSPSIPLTAPCESTTAHGSSGPPIGAVAVG